MLSPRADRERFKVELTEPAARELPPATHPSAPDSLPDQIHHISAFHAAGLEPLGPRDQETLEENSAQQSPLHLRAKTMAKTIHCLLTSPGRRLGSQKTPGEERAYTSLS